MGNNCQVPTPTKYVDELLDCIGYTHNLFGKTVLENSCGEGNILKNIVKRYINSSLKEGYSKKQISCGLEKHITAYDIDPVCVKKCIENLNEIVKEYGLSNICWNIHNKDYLKCNKGNYHYIIGNPPYITHHDLTVAQRLFLKEKYSTCQEGRFDYCYAFIEAGLRDLTQDGKLIYIVPYSVIKNKYASKIRELIKKHLNAIIDYKGIHIFPNTLTSSVVILCNMENNEYIYYHSVKDKIINNIAKSSLKDKWVFETIKETGTRRFGDYFKVSNSIATLCNKAFVFESRSEDDLYYYLESGRIEKGVVFDASSSKSEKKYIAKRKRDKIIFPYKILNGSILNYNEDLFKEEFPECYSYLTSFKTELLKRNFSKGVKWFEYGRVQAINNIFVDKLVMAGVVTNNVNVYSVGVNSIPYAGIFISVLSGGILDLSIAKEILQSKLFYEYIKRCGTPTTTSSYRISVKDIENYYF